MINFVVSGRFTFPEGMASTKRIKNYLSYLNNLKSIQTSVLLLWNNDKNIKQFGTDFKYEGTSVKIVGLTVASNLAHFLFLPFSNFLAVFFLISKLRQNNVLLIYDGISYENIFYVIVAKFMGYKIIVDVVEDYRLHKEKVSTGSKLRIWSIINLEKITLKFIDGLIIISSYLEKKYFKYSFENISLVKIPVSASFNYPSSEFNDSYNAKIFYGGGNGIKDGLKYLVSAFRRIKEKYPFIELFITGEPNPELIKTINGKGVTFLGFLPDIEYYQLIREMDILCIPRINSDYANAGFPFKLAEYLATGKIVVASNLSELDEYLKDEVNVFFVTPESILDLENTFEKILNGWENSKTVAQQGYISGRNVFDINVVGEKLVKLIYKLIND